jgi:hypothetical protein
MNKPMFLMHSQSPLNEAGAASEEKVLVSLYNGKPGISLDSLRHKRVCEKVAVSTSHVEPQSLPPTQFHSFRVYYQVHKWQRSNEILRPEEWESMEREGRKTDPYPNKLAPSSC